MVLLSQLNRGLENRTAPGEKRPKLSDLRDSGNIEQDADAVIFLYRPEVYNDTKDDPFPGQAELNIAKQRNGPTGMVMCRWIAESTKFLPIDQRGNYER